MVMESALILLSSVAAEKQVPAVAKSSKRYPCKVCDKDFSTSGHLSRHRRIHFGNKRYQCEVPGCDRTFFRADNCYQHTKSHKKRLEQEVRGVAAVQTSGTSGATDTSYISIPASPPVNAQVLVRSAVYDTRPMADQKQETILPLRPPYYSPSPVESPPRFTGSLEQLCEGVFIEIF
ncbi:transcriptional repressor [Rhizoclosmatium sp. JEL0117]|nr:transcriptional repressor [Rhizoclosmatium sp. JEL0117]